MFNNFRAVATSHETVSRTKPYSAQRPTTPPHDDNDSCYRLEPSHSNKHSTFVRNSSHNSRFSNSTLELQAPTQTFPAHASTFAESHCYSASSDQSLIDEFSCNNTRRSGLAVQFSPNSAITSVNYTACNFGRQPPPCIVPLNATPEIHPALTAQVIIDQKPAVVTSAPNDISNSTTKAENHTISPQLRQHSAFSLLSRKLDNPAGYKKQWKAWMYHVLHPSKHQTALTGFSKFLHYFFIVNTVVSIALLIASTDPILASNFKAEVVMFTFDSVVTTVFLIEFLMHVSIAKSWWAFWNVSRVLDLLNIGKSNI